MDKRPHGQHTKWTKDPVHKTPHAQKTKGQQNEWTKDLMDKRPYGQKN